MKLAVISELLAPPYDEGFKKTAAEMVHALERRHEVHALRAGHAANPLDARSGLRWCPSMAAQLRHIEPDAVLYIPAASLSFLSFVRLRLLQILSRNRAPFAIIGLQERTYAPWQQRLLPHLRPDVVFVQTAREQDAWTTTGSAGILPARSASFRAALLPSGIDLARFSPLDPLARAALRTRLGLEATRPVVLHVGHLKPGRNLDALAEPARVAGFDIVVLASTSTHADPAVVTRLREAGGRLVDGFVPAVEEWYQAADAYVFPVLEARSAISFPLSVLEAMACNLPVVTTPFGSLPEAFANVPGLHFWDGRSPLCPLIDKALAEPAHTRNAVQPYSWDAVAATIERELMAVRGEAPSTPSTSSTTPRGQS